MEPFQIKEFASLVAGRFKSIDPTHLEGGTNIIYDPVKSSIAVVSDLVNCIVNVGSWSIAGLTATETTSTVNVGEMIVTSACERIFVHSMRTYCQATLASEAPNRISREIIASGDDELTFVKKNKIGGELASIFDIADKTFVGKEYQTATELLVDSESEQWETLLLRFYLSATPDQCLGYQKELIKQFVSKIEPTKRIYFSILIEPI